MLPEEDINVAPTRKEGIILGIILERCCYLSMEKDNHGLSPSPTVSAHRRDHSAFYSIYAGIPSLRSMNEIKPMKS